MITFLAWVTVIYAVILVLVLAVSLITILFYLWSIGTTLARISGGLNLVRQQTGPLGGHIEAINGALSTVSIGLASALDDLADANTALGSVLGESTPEVEKVA